MDSMFLLFVSKGFVAQLLDGSIGMGFGLISYTVLINMGYPPAVVSASVNGAKLFTGTVSGFAHFRLKNIDWRMLRLVAGGGVVGALAGSLLPIKLPHDWLVPLINCYLIGVGIVILWRAGQSNITKASSLKTGLVGLAGGVLESLAGVWRPMVTSNLIAAGSKDVCTRTHGWRAARGSVCCPVDKAVATKCPDDCRWPVGHCNQRIPPIPIFFTLIVHGDSHGHIHTLVCRLDSRR